MAMIRITNFRKKEVIDINDGKRIGFVLDIDIDESTGKIIHIIVPGKFRLFFFLTKENDYIIPWERVRTIGEDIILVDINS